ncbi:hypothetical protein RB597_007034 [Gaeumannomyces tritici]
MEQQQEQPQQQKQQQQQIRPQLASPVGEAAAYYTSASPVPVPGATALATSGPLPLHGGPPPPASGNGGPLTHFQQQPNGSSGGHPQHQQQPNGNGGGHPQYQQQYQQPPKFDPPPLAPMSPSPMTQQGSLTQSPGPMVAATTATTHGLRGARLTTESALREYMALQRRRNHAAGSDGVDIGARIKLQSGVLVGELYQLRRRVADLVKAAEQHRWRRWLIGGIVGTVIPMVRTLFRRPATSIETSNSTEYAFFRSKSLLGRIMDSVKGLGGLASITFFVFSVLYVFQNEVSLRVAKTLSKRLRRLSNKVEDTHQLDDRDIALLSGWRWRILDVSSSK